MSSLRLICDQRTVRRTIEEDHSREPIDVRRVAMLARAAAGEPLASLGRQQCHRCCSDMPASRCVEREQPENRATAAPPAAMTAGAGDSKAARQQRRQRSRGYDV